MDEPRQPRVKRAKALGRRGMGREVANNLVYKAADFALSKGLP